MAIKNDKQEDSFPENTTVFPFSFEKNEVDSNGIWVNLEKDTEPEVRITNEEATAVNKVETVADKPEATSRVNKQYHIIAGCFRDEVNANKFVSRLKSKGYDASILDFHKNLHRVQTESFSNYSTALQKLQSVRNDGTFPNAWMLKKPQS